MAGERHGILSLGRRAVAIVATSPVTDVPLAHLITGAWCMPKAGAGRFDADFVGSNRDLRVGQRPESAVALVR